MDNTSTLGSLPTLLVCPGFYLHLASSNERFQVQQGIGLFNQTIDTTLFQAQFLQEHLLVFVRFKFSDIFFCLGCYNHGFSTFLFSQCFHFLREVVATFGISLTHIANIQNRLGSQQEQITSTVLLVFALEFHDTSILSLLQNLFVSLQHSNLYLCIFIACSSSLLRLSQTTLNGFEVFQLKLCINDFLVADGVDGSIHMGDILIFETTQYMDDGIRFTNITQEFIT